MYAQVAGQPSDPETARFGRHANELVGTYKRRAELMRRIGERVKEHGWT
jgi:hypothetical protein